MDKTLTIMRGLPGAGKSFRIQHLLRNPRPMVFSANYFFMADGVYRYNPSRIGEAHADCLRRCINAMNVDTSWIVIDNTNIKLWEMGPYRALAEAFKYSVEVADIFDGGCTNEELFARQHHGVPLHKIARMRSEYER